MGTRKQAKPAQKKPAAAKDAKAAKPKTVRTKAPAGSAATAGTEAEPVDLAELRIEMIARAAYLRAEQRGFEPGRELEDWLAAAADIDAQLARRSSE